VRFEKRPYDPIALERAVRRGIRVQEEAKLETEKAYREQVEQEKLRRPRVKRVPIETATEPSEPGKLKLWTWGKTKVPVMVEPKPKPSEPGKLRLWETGVKSKAKPKPRLGLRPAELQGRRARDISESQTAAHVDRMWDAIQRGKFPGFQTVDVTERLVLKAAKKGLIKSREQVELIVRRQPKTQEDAKALWQEIQKPTPKTTVKLPPVKSGKLTLVEKRNIGEALAQITERGQGKYSDTERAFVSEVIKKHGTIDIGADALQVRNTLERVVPERGPLPSPLPNGVSLKAPKGPYTEVPVTLPRAEVLAGQQRELTELRAKMRSASGIDRGALSAEIKATQDNISNIKKAKGNTIRVRGYKSVELPPKLKPAKRPPGPLPSPRTGGGISQPQKPLGPAIEKTNTKLLSRIHITRKSQKVPENIFREAVSEATGGRTSSTKALTNEEARYVLSRLKVAPPTGVKREPAKPGRPFRKPPAEVVAQEKADIAQSLEEVKRYTGQKFIETPGAPKKPPLLTRLKRSTAYQFIFGKGTSYQTKVQQAGGKGSKTEEILDTRLRESRSKTQASANAAKDATIQTMRQHKITTKHVQRWGDKQEAYHLSGGRRLRITPAEAAKIVQLGMDPEVRNGISRWGVTFRDVGPDRRGRGFKLSILDQRALAVELRTRHPKLGQFLDFTFRWMNGPGAAQIAKAYEQETGKTLKISGTYANSLRDIRALRGTEAAKLSEEAQYDRAIKEITERLGYGPKRAAPKAPPGGPKLTKYRPPGELRHLPIMKERVGSKAPYRVNNLFVDFLAHYNRVANYSGKAVGIRNAQLLLNDPGFQKAMRQGFRDGEIRLADMRKHLQAFKGLDVMSKDTLDRIASGILRRATIGTLGLKPHIVAYQPISYLNAFTEIPARYLLSGKALSLSLATRRQTLAEINRYGPELRARFEGSGHLIMTPSLTTPMKEQVSIAYGGKRGVIERAAMFGIRKADQATMMRIWRASKAWARADGFRGAELLQETNRRTMRAADRTQPTWDPLTITTLQLEARKNPIKRAMVMFTSQAGKNYNMAVRAIDEFAHTRRGTPGRYAKLISGVGIPIAVNATMVYGISHGMRKAYGYSMDEKSYVDHIGGVLSRAMGGWIPMGNITADLGRMIKDRFGDKAKIFIEPRHNILIEALDQGMEVVGKMIPELLEKYAKQARTGRLKDEEAYERAIERAIPQVMRAVSTWTGLPISGVEQIARPHLKPDDIKR
jgi:hypothetical protein